jgi:lipoate-protein ligase B
VQFVDLGKVGYNETLKKQTETVERIARGTEVETVYLLEHPHTFTIGRRGVASNLLQDHDFEGRRLKVIRINRGGDITYHGPGQLVGYPHLDLRLRRRDLHRYLRNLEECLIKTAKVFGVEAFRRKGLTGVWTDFGKLASIGVGVRQWVSMHGFALNVSTDLRYFTLINPCGIPDCSVTSLEHITGNSIPIADVKFALQEEFLEIFEPRRDFT